MISSDDTVTPGNNCDRTGPELGPGPYHALAGEEQAGSAEEWCEAAFFAATRRGNHLTAARIYAAIQNATAMGMATRKTMVVPCMVNIWL